MAAVFTYPLAQQLRVSYIGLVLVSGLTFGIGFFLIGVIRRRVRLRSFALNLLAQTALIAVTPLVGFYVIVCFVAAESNHVPVFSTAVFEGALRFTFGPGMLPKIGLAILMAGVINMIFLVNEKMGPGVIWNWITGKYYTPREEELVFMFLDMKDSTTLAEQLGAMKFSALVRDFFRDTMFPLLESKARVSHYIGDEAVIYWRPSDAVKDANCLQFFYRFQSALQKRADYYKATYGLVPAFKAGLHVGPVVATEVGEVKSEIVFHGDVLNTTARIQAQCNESGQSLLISKNLADRIQVPTSLKLDSLGPFQLKGKAQEIELLAVSTSSTP